MEKKNYYGRFSDPFMTLQSSVASDTPLKCLAPCDTELRSPLLASITLENCGLSFSWTNCPTWKSFRYM